MGRLSKAKWCLAGGLIAVIVLAGVSVFIPGKLTSGVKWVANNDFVSRLRTPTGQETLQERQLVEMIVETVGVSRIDYQSVAILKEKGGELYLPVWIGFLEANAISVILEGAEVPRPLTADLLCSIIERMGAKVDYIVITDLRDHTFYARIILKTDWQRMEIDARPSDAIAVALRVKAPIYVEKTVLEQAGIRKEGEPKI